MLVLQSPLKSSYIIVLFSSLLFLHMHPGIIYSSHFLNKPLCRSCPPSPFPLLLFNSPSFYSFHHLFFPQSSVVIINESFSCLNTAIQSLVLILFTSPAEFNEYEWSPSVRDSSKDSSFSNQWHKTHFNTRRLICSPIRTALCSDRQHFFSV